MNTEEMQTFVYSVANKVRREQLPLFTEFALKMHARLANEASLLREQHELLGETERQVISTAFFGFMAWVKCGAELFGDENGHVKTIATRERIVAFTVRLFLAWIEIRETAASASVGAGVSA